MKKILLTLALIIFSVSNSYASQDQGSKKYQDRLAKIIVQIARVIPCTAAKIIDLTMPSQEKFVYFLYGDKILKFDQINMEKNRK